MSQIRNQLHHLRGFPRPTFLPVRSTLSALLALAAAAPLSARTVTLDPIAVTASRAPQPAQNVPFALVTLPGDALRAAPTLTLDQALRSVPGFSLFRRSDSFTANPTAQGVSLRGLGPSGASRSLVLLDGIPLTDPFGGWVSWSQVPRESLASAELVRGGGATAWGNVALGGVVQLLTESTGAPAGRFAAALGDFSTRSAELAVNQPVGSGTLQLSGRTFATDGFSLVAPEDRGSIDIPASSEHNWLSLRWRQPVGEDTELIVAARTFEEHRNNGTPYTRNATEIHALSAELRHRQSAVFQWTALAYGQDQSFSSTFSSVTAARDAETPASNQYDVPATAAGLAWTGIWQTDTNTRTNAGVDLRQVRGETREHFFYSAGDFTRERRAGGRQQFAGLFVLHERALASDLHANIGARVDFWRDDDGRRREFERATGATLRDDRYSARDDVEFSPSAGLVWQPAPAWRLRAAGQYAFRRPTLNELYRPFRVGNTTTESNPALATEHALNLELGADYTTGNFTWSATAFRSELRDAVANVTIARGPVTHPVFGFLADGVTGRQKLNLDRALVQGLELAGTWTPLETLSLRASYLFDDTEVRRATVAPQLVGLQLAQVPRHSASLEATWRPLERLALTSRLRWLGRQFEDDENRLVLAAAAVVDLSIQFSVTSNVTLFATAENVGDERIETGRNALGIVNTGTPRLVVAGLRATW